MPEERPKELVEALTRLHIRISYRGQPCPHCGKPLAGSIEEDGDLIWSNGGKYRNQPCAAHATCFYRHEADDEWRAENPQHAPASASGERE